MVVRFSCSGVWGSLFASASVVFPSDTPWKYLAGRSEASPWDVAAWRTLSFDDSAWGTGEAPFYYENQPGSGNAFTGNTALPDMQGNYTSIFLRKTFVINNPSDIRELELVSLSDDGFIAWINGAEVARFNMPLGEVAYNGLSLPALYDRSQCKPRFLPGRRAPGARKTSLPCKPSTARFPAAAILSFRSRCRVLWMINRRRSRPSSRPRTRWFSS